MTCKVARTHPSLQIWSGAISIVLFLHRAPWAAHIFSMFSKVWVPKVRGMMSRGQKGLQLKVGPVRPQDFCHQMFEWFTLTIHMGTEHNKAGLFGRIFRRLCCEKSVLSRYFAVFVVKSQFWADISPALLWKVCFERIFELLAGSSPPQSQYRWCCYGNYQSRFFLQSLPNKTYFLCNICETSVSSGKPVGHKLRKNFVVAKLQILPGKDEGSMLIWYLGFWNYVSCFPFDCRDCQSFTPQIIYCWRSQLPEISKCPKHTKLSAHWEALREVSVLS